MAAEKPSSDARKQRLARALKANIAKRKAQAREQAKAQQAGVPEPSDPPPDEESCPN